jgi:hypothetical protein
MLLCGFVSYIIYPKKRVRIAVYFWAKKAAVSGTG